MTELIKILEPDFTFTDDRGTLAQLCSGGWGQVNAVYTRAGARRGRLHYHAENDEAFFIISGRARVTASLGGETETREFGAGEMFMIPRFVRHDFLYLEDTYLVGLYTGCVEKPDGSRDILTDE